MVAPLKWVATSSLAYPVTYTILWKEWGKKESKQKKAERIGQKGCHGTTSLPIITVIQFTKGHYYSCSGSKKNDMLVSATHQSMAQLSIQKRRRKWKSGKQSNAAANGFGNFDYDRQYIKTVPKVYRSATLAWIASIDPLLMRVRVYPITWGQVYRSTFGTIISYRPWDCLIPWCHTFTVTRNRAWSGPNLSVMIGSFTQAAEWSQSQFRNLIPIGLYHNQ